MRVTLLDLLFQWPPDGGARVDTLEFARWLRRRGHEVELLTPLIPDVFPRGAVRQPIDVPLVQPVPPADLAPVDLAGWIAERTIQRRADVVWLGDAWQLKARLVKALAPVRPIVRFYAHESLCLKGHGHQYRDDDVCPVNVIVEPGRFESDCLPCLRRWREATTSKSFDLELAASEPERGDYLADLIEGLKAARAIVVSNREMVRRLSPLGVPVIRQPMGVDHNRFRPSGPPEGSRFLMFGRVYDYLKGSTFVLEAARRLWSKRRDFRLVVTGRPFRHEAAPEVDPFLEVQPFHPHEEVPGLLRESFACLIPPLWPEPFPLVAVEAMACGRPVIGTDAGGLAELLEDGVNGLVVPPRDPGALAAAMGRLLDDRPLARRLAERGLETARTYSWKELYERAYGELFPPIC